MLIVIIFNTVAVKEDNSVFQVGTELMALESDANRDQLQQLYK